MITTLEIIDTAIKIGLGALISGIATYVVTRRNHAHDKSKELVLFRRNTLVDVSKMIKESTNLTNELFYLIRLKWKKLGSLEGENLEKELGLTKKILHHTNETAIFCHLINDKDLIDCTRNYSRNCLRIHELIREHKFGQFVEYNELRKLNFELRDKVLEQIGTSMENIYD